MDGEISAICPQGLVDIGYHAGASASLGWRDEVINMRPNASFEPDRSPYRPAGPMPTQSSSSYYSGPFGWWFRLTVPPEPPASADFATRDRARRGRLGGALLFGLLALMILAVFIGLGDPATLVSSLVGVRRRHHRHRPQPEWLCQRRRSDHGRASGAGDYLKYCVRAQRPTGYSLSAAV